MKDGIQISLAKLNSIVVAEDGATVTIGGGTVSKSLTSALWAVGKQTGWLVPLLCARQYVSVTIPPFLVTGSCECVSILGPGLGGGHGLLQGRHGLIQDQFVSYELVQADGTVHTINESSELWWAMRGAGHNFGIVTSATMKIHDIEHEDWSYEMFFFSGAAIEGLYGNINDHLMAGGKAPVDVVSVSVFLNVPQIDPDNVSKSLSLRTHTDKQVGCSVRHPPRRRQSRPPQVAEALP